MTDTETHGHAGNGRRRALVLGGGGLTGHAWLIGMLLELADRGFDAAGADLVVGTSCGAVVGAQIACGLSPREMHDRFFAANTADLRLAPEEFLELARLLTGSPDLQDALVNVGAAALGHRDVVSCADLADTLRAQIPATDWPAQRLVLPAVDARTGEFHRLAAGPGMSMLDAVWASCSLPFVYEPATIAGRRWIDGFLRSPANVDCAGGYERIVVLAPMDLGFSPRGAVSDQVKEEIAAGSSVLSVFETEQIATMTENRMDPRHFAPVVQMARAQAAVIAQDVLDLWEV
jgi:NTE family protein